MLDLATSAGHFLSLGSSLGPGLESPIERSFFPDVNVSNDKRCDKYEDLAATGWEPTREEIERDVRDLFGGALERFLKS